MVMPALSVTAIAIVVGVVAISRKKPAAATLLRAFAGAWLGFVAGAVPGVIADVLAGSGAYVAVVGHIGAVLGAVAAVTWWRRRAVDHAR